MPPGMDNNDINEGFFNPYDVCKHKIISKRASLGVFV